MIFVDVMQVVWTLLFLFDFSMTYEVEAKFYRSTI